MKKNLFSRTAATSFVLGLAMAASAQQANFLSNNHCIYPCRQLTESASSAGAREGRDVQCQGD